MLKSQFVLTYLYDFFWVVYHSDRDQIMCSQTDHATIFKLCKWWVLCSTFSFNNILCDSTRSCMYDRWPVQEAIILELIYLISVFQCMALKLSSYSFELVYPFTPRSAQNENSSSSRQVRNSWYSIVKAMLKRFHLYGQTIRFHPQTQKLEPL